MAGIYFHIPFCKQACHYCDFYFSTDSARRREVLEAMASEIVLRKEYLKPEKISSVYFGGGTPSLLTADEVGLLLRRVDDTFDLSPDAEITLEANPDDLGYAKAEALRGAGVNRLSIGIQSFDSDVLAFLNRAHDAGAAFASVEHARAAGFDNISIDLIYAIPGLSEEKWLETITHAVRLMPAHISAYALTVEPETAFGVWAKKGRLRIVSDDNAAQQLEMLTAALGDAGYEQYEVSNYCMPGMESRHNSSYWKQHPYLGIGPSAHSYDLESRQFNVRNNALYVKSLRAGRIPFEIEHLTPADHVNEYLLTTLRTKWGSDLEKLRTQYHYDVLATHGDLINKLVDRKLATLDRHVLMLTKAGRLLADKITADLFLVF